MSKTKGLVEKERVVCQNCRYQYSYLYEARKAVETLTPTLTGSLKNYINTRESYRPCPHCGFVQDWMVGARRGHRLVDLALMMLVGAAAVLLYLVYQMIAVALNPLASGSFEPVYQAQQILFAYLGLVVVTALGYYGYLHLFWNPNKTVDTESYEAATAQEVCAADAISAASQYEAATRLAKEEELPRKRILKPWTVLSRIQKIGISLGILAGLASFLAPAVSPDLALTLAQRGLTMMPFYTGLIFILAAAVCGSWQYLDEVLR